MRSSKIWSSQAVSTPMQTNIAPELQSDLDVQVSEQQLRTCVHCGFCNATCPTYLLTGNELEGPRGRIYLIKNLLEGKIEPSAGTISHIDNCLGCLACETTCPSGVTYSHLLEDVRPRLEHRGIRDFWDRVLRTVLVHLLPYPGRFRLAMRLSWLGRLTSFMLPARFRPLVAMAPGSLPRPATLREARRHPGRRPGWICAAAASRPPHRMRAADSGSAHQRRRSATPEPSRRGDRHSAERDVLWRPDLSHGGTPAISRAHAPHGGSVARRNGS